MFHELLPSAWTDSRQPLREKGAGSAPDGQLVTLSVGVAEYRADETPSGPRSWNSPASRACCSKALMAVKGWARGGLRL